MHMEQPSMYYYKVHCLVPVNLILYDCSVLDTKSGPAPFLFRYVRSRFFRAIAPGLSCSRDIGQKIYQSRVLSVCTGVSMTSLAEQSLAQFTECRFFLQKNTFLIWIPVIYTSKIKNQQFSIFKINYLHKKSA